MSRHRQRCDGCDEYFPAGQIDDHQDACPAPFDTPAPPDVPGYGAWRRRSDA